MVSGRAPGSAPPALIVWMNGEKVGKWSVRDQLHRFQYDESWLASSASRPLSVSLPFTPGNVPHQGPVVRNFFDNLLPDNDVIRRRIRERFMTGSSEAYSLLAAVGRDCVGAVQLLAEGDEPAGFDRIEFDVLDEKGVERSLLDATSSTRIVGREDLDHFRISLAGAQEKTALLRESGHWCLPNGATPTTHIFKLPLGLIGNIRADMSGSVENEWLCARLLARYGLPVAQADIARFGDTKVLVVERFDRGQRIRPDGRRWLARLPQEDMCQALGLPGELRYESDGGPGMPAILRLLGRGTHPEADKLTFLKAQFLYWIMAATDGHAKNFSIFLERGGFRMTPLYDVLSVWPIIGTGPNLLHWRRAKLAMALRSKNVHYHLHEIRPRHWAALAAQSGVPDAFDHLVALALQTPLVLEEVAEELPAAFPGSIFESIRKGMCEQATRFMSELEATPQ